MSSSLKRTALHSFHKSLGAQLVPFAGWHMPVVYKDMNISASHMYCRENAGLFDVSHMGQLKISGKNRYKYVESLVPGNILDLKPGNARLTQLTNEKGGIRDDTIITKRANEDKLYMVVNAGCADADLKYMYEQLEKWSDVSIELLPERSLLALQGPKAVDVLQRMVKYDLADLGFMSQADITVNGFEHCYVSRCGYTGEDGFEISVPSEHAEALAQEFLKHDVAPIGLGARDTLRLEAGLCLMGQDMTEDITPIEAGLKFTVGKRRREEGNFPGAEVIVKQFEEGTDRVRVGFTMDESKRAPRTHYPIRNENGDEIGEVTSGTVSPCLQKPIGMGYIATPLSSVGNKINIDIRGQLYAATVTALPFVPTTFYRKPKKSN
mmetsp:Transcript_7304/g.27336  ORF Transcript_7304/g.27336 Transcript_7304/m.27336 type:complete len:380 (-) Transcript_7304:1860-2999(-)